MPLGAREKKQLLRALELALEWHGEQHRRGSKIPYVSHLLQVSGLVLEHGGDAEQAVAGLLHDALEDAPSAASRLEREGTIRETFGDGALGIVLDCTDTEEHEHAGRKGPWKRRKTRYLTRLEQADARTLLVAACDKRHNLGALVGDVKAHGIGYLDRFRGENENQVWYFARVVKITRGRIPKRLHQELKRLLARFERQVEAG